MRTLASGESKKNTPFSCPPSLLERIDEAAVKSTLNRSAWLRIAAMEKLEREKQAKPQELEY